MLIFVFSLSCGLLVVALILNRLKIKMLIKNRHMNVDFSLLRKQLVNLTALLFGGNFIYFI